ncbi:zinc-binding dehydrogenase [Streptomyces griseoincarnatus]|uniref:zinc-binding dehydrogenase n=1 Tax=Streptomyces sp. SMS_SU21 TaxID=2069440 RepID=UPI000D1C8D96|nr:zinc-binding dehydrogenase [Streptomyces sp. SMS_SU21]MCA2199636.1 zinc-binding dehydrogenase [Streptomyces sp. SMS_SU21]NEA91512.1 zinc-binding dehydrogenase [Actinospica acidiphila]
MTGAQVRRTPYTEAGGTRGGRGRGVVVMPHLAAVTDRAAVTELAAVTEPAGSGRITPVIGRTYALGGAAEVVRHVERGHAPGRTVLTVR